MHKEPTLIILHGGCGTHEAEQLIADAKIKVAQSNALNALQAGFRKVIISTDSAESFTGLGDNVSIIPDQKTEKFNFQKSIETLLESFSIEHPVVMSSGAAPLLGIQGFMEIVMKFQNEEPVVITNNFFSSDLVGWQPVDAFKHIGHVERDNELPRLLRDHANCTPSILAKSPSTQFDLDTPSDLCVLKIWEKTPKDLRAQLQDHGLLPLKQYRQAMQEFCNPEAEVAILGRVGSNVWQYLEKETACRIRIISEERGLATSNREARSLAGYLLEEVGPKHFIDIIETLGDVIIIDTRVLLEHLKLETTREERFQSDLLAYQPINNSLLREFTKTVAQSKKPILLGGHNLVSSGLIGLVEQAWIDNDQKLTNQSS